MTPTGLHAVVGTVVGAGVRADVPVTPDADEARRQAVEELSKPVYHQQRSLLNRLLDWVLDQLDDMASHVSVAPRFAVLALVVVVVVAVAVMLWVAGPVRRSRGRSTTVAVHDADDTRTADELRAAADRAAAAGEWSLAVLERFRAVARSLEERAVLDERPGRTAHEASLEAGAAFPTLVDQLDAGAHLFDDVAYGGRSGGPEDDDLLRRLDRALAGARPRVGGPAVALPAVPR